MTSVRRALMACAAMSRSSASRLRSRTAARIAGELFQYLDAPIRRVGALDAPVAYAPDLEDAILPQAHDILKAIKDTVRY